MNRSSRIQIPVLAALVFVAGCGYNTIQTLDEKVNQAQGQIQTQLQRRSDLIPNLVNTVKGITKQEDTVFISIANARARLGGAVQSGNVPEMAAANQQLSSGPRAPPRDRGELPPAPIESELPPAPGTARGHRKSGRRCPAGLQHGGGGIQRVHPAVSLQPHRQGLRARDSAGVLRGGSRGHAGAEGEVLGRSGKGRSERKEKRKPR